MCEASYKRDVLENAGIEVRDLAFEDGTPPPPNVVDEWFEVLKQKWDKERDRKLNFNTYKTRFNLRYNENPEGCVAVHCVAGLGRAPVLVALALIELGLKYEGAVELIREWVSDIWFFKKFNANERCF